jgi:predicted kinase
LWLDAPESVLIARSDQRRGDVSDADAAVIRQQIAHFGGDVEWLRLNASVSPAEIRRSAGALLRQRLPGEVIRQPLEPRTELHAPARPPK